MNENERQIRQVVGAYAADPTIIVFGSLAAGAARFDSDLDVAVDIGALLGSEDRLDLVMALGSALGRPVDLVDLQTVGEPLLGQILRHGRRLQGSDEQYASLIRRHIFESTDFLPYRDRILQARRLAWIGK